MGEEQVKAQMSFDLKALTCLLVLLFSVVSVAQFVLNDDEIAELNSMDLPWQAGRNPRFEGVTMSQARRMMGTIIKSSNKNVTKGSTSAEAIPKHFDSRDHWAHCHSIGHILNQGDCGSCWAFGAAESLSDRLCIRSGGKIKVELSPQDLVSCDDVGNHGCDGGVPQLAWEYLEYEGITDLSCYPYESGTSGKTGDCRRDCKDSKQPFTKYYADKFSQHTYDGVEAIQNAILGDGPVEGTMSVYSDFMHYKSGVYVKSAKATYMGGHAIKIIGWGHDDKVKKDYWIVNNSWGTDWGINGTFWIERGVNMCGIDSDAVASQAKV